jgi:phosphatidylinositol-3-phosphatase
VRAPSIVACLALSAGLLTWSGPASAATSGDGLESIPHFDHVVVLVEENEDESDTFGPDSPAHFLNQTLVPKGVFLPSYYGTGHVSLDNYIAMVSGQPGNGVTNTDCLAVNFWTCAQSTLPYDGGKGRNLGDQFDAAGVSWAGYMDGMPSSCFHADYSPTAQPPDPYQGNSRTPPAYDYADRHNPFLYFPDIVENADRCAGHDVPFTQLSSDLADNALPQFSFITPDTCHDGHDAPCSDGSPGGLTGMDNWLAANVQPLLDYLFAHNGLLVITFDESNPSSPPKTLCQTCAGGGAGGQIGALLLSPRLAGGTTVSSSYDHYSLLRTVEDSFGISEHLNLANQAAPMTDVFAGSGNPQLPEAPLPALITLAGIAVVAALLRLRTRRAHLR